MNIGFGMWSRATHSQHRTWVVLIVLKRYAAIPGALRIDIFHAVVSISVLTTESISISTLREDASDKAGALACSIVCHVWITWNRAGCAGTFAVEENHEDQSSKQSQSSEDTNDDASNWTTAQTGIIVTGLGFWGVCTRSRIGSSNSDSLDLSTRGRLLDDVTGCGGRRGWWASLWSQVSNPRMTTFFVVR